MDAAETQPLPAHDDEGAFAEHVAALNLQRIAWFMLVTLACLLGAAISGLFLSPPWPSRMIAGMIADSAAAGVALAGAVLLRRKFSSVSLRKAFATTVLVALLAVMDFYFFTLLPVHGRTSTYAIGVICAAVLVVVPARRLLPLLAFNHAAFLSLLATSGLPRTDRFIAAIDGSLGVAIAALAAWLLHAAKRNDFLRAAQLARQGRALTAANATLRERNAEMNELMAITAHDLRSPLQGVKHLVEWTEAQPALAPEKRRQALHEVGRTCATMLRLIGRLLEAHAAETTPLSGRIVAGDIMPVAQEALRRATILAEARGIRCQLSAPATGALARHDPAALQQILDNLLANAVKFSPDGARVQLEIAARDDHCTLAVVDEGPGVPLSERPRLFHKFHRGAQPAASGETGSGLGLFIVRTLAEAMGGSVRYEARPPRGGAFVVALPLAPAATPFKPAEASPALAP